ncbi:MAG: rhodoquinone biosynthesis methyltransferase RquA [Pseudomonadota bacterium]
MDELVGADVVSEDGRTFAEAGAERASASRAVRVPDYLRDTYSWAYLNPRTIGWLDTRVVVEGILWGNFTRLVDAALDEFEPGMAVLQPACVYGDLSPRLADHLGPNGRLLVSDVAPLQLANTAPKLEGRANATTRLLDAADHPPGDFDAVCCFFLLHEIPEGHRRRVVTSLLNSVRPGGKVVFVDYHAPSAWHPMRPLMSLVFDMLEPFAKDLWRQDIRAFGEPTGRFRWSKRTYFGGLYQKVVAVAA